MSRPDLVRERAARLGRPRVHLPGMVGRARADGLLLLLTALVVAVAALLAGLVPPAAGRAADRAADAVVAAAGDRATLTASKPLETLAEIESVGRAPDTAEIIDNALASTRQSLRPVLADVMQPSVASLVTEPLGVLTREAGRSVQLAYVASGPGDPRVVWTSGVAPRASVPVDRARDPVPFGVTWTVEVGLTEPAAAALGVRPGAVLQASDRNLHTMLLRVSGVYRAVDEGDAVWHAAPGLLRPRTFVNSTGHSAVDVAALLSRESVPDARVAVGDLDLRVSLAYRPRPEAVHWQDLAALRDATVAVQAGILGGPVTSGPPVSSTTWYSSLDGVLRDVQDQLAAARAQAAALLAGLVAVALLVLALTAELLGRRRSAPLAVSRTCGASLPGLAVELLGESVLVTALGAAVGTGAALLLGGGAVPTALAPLLAMAALAPVVTGVLAAAAVTGGRRAPANRSARRVLQRLRRGRTWALEATGLLLAAGALVALRQRGVATGAVTATGTAGPSGVGPSGGWVPDDLLPALAPALCAFAAAMLLRRLLLPGGRLAAARAARSRRALPLVVAARLTTTAGRLLPVAAIAVPAALLGLGSAVVATEDEGQQAVAWQAIGADVRLQADPAPAVAEAARRLAAAPGVRTAVAARVEDDVSLWSQGGAWPVRLVVVDAAGYAALLDAGPLPGADALRQLARTSDGEQLPALLRTSRPALTDSRVLRVAWEGSDVRVQVVGTAPAVGEGPGEVLVVDARSAAAHRLALPPDTIWATGPGAVAAARALAGADAGHPFGVVVRDDVRRQRAAAPLAAALRRLAAVAEVGLVVLGVLGLALGAAVGSPERRATLARLRTLGLRRRHAWRLLLGELLPPALAAGLLGFGAGLLLATACLESLGLRLVTGQPTEPVLVVPWWAIGPVLIMVASVVVLVAIETAARRGDRVGLVLRAGES